MCGEEGSRLIPCCENGHYLHEICLMNLKDPICPMCRSGCLKTLKETTEVPLIALCRTPFSHFGAVVAFHTGLEELEIFRRPLQ